MRRRNRGARFYQGGVSDVQGHSLAHSRVEISVDARTRHTASRAISPVRRVPISGRLKLAWRSRAVALLACLIVAVAALAILSTSRMFSGTVDEPAHIAAGMQWITTDRYDYDLQHPPLGRVAAAIGPYLKGARGVAAPSIYDEGASILGTGDRYAEVLASARHGEIVFFLVMAAVVWAWGRRLGGDLVAAPGTVLLVTNPTVLAHAGLATTDIACAATTVLALFAAAWWIEQPSWSRSLLFGAAIGAAIGSRLSAIAFVGGPLAICYILRGLATRTWRIDRSGARASVAAISLVTVATVGVVAALYRFHIGLFITGVGRFLLHGSSGHPTFLLGTPSNRGWWYYFPVALLVKTPPPLLIATLLGAVGAVAGWRERRDWLGAAPLVAALTILVISLTVKVDLGVRLVLPVYPLLAIAGAQGLSHLVRTRPSAGSRAVVAALLVWSMIAPIRSYPDYLAYFNALAGDHPENVLVDSNLDWGQDLYRLRDTLAARHIADSVRVAYFGTADLSAVGVPRARQLGLHERPTGWVAASETYLAGEWVGGAYAWLLYHKPVARIGPSMRLWYIERDTVSADQVQR